MRVPSPPRRRFAKDALDLNRAIRFSRIEKRYAVLMGRAGKSDHVGAGQSRKRCR